MIASPIHKTGGPGSKIVIPFDIIHIDAHWDVLNTKLAISKETPTSLATRGMLKAD